jgi:hypothetical protein
VIQNPTHHHHHQLAVLCTYGTNEFAQDLGLPCEASKFETQMQNSQAKLKTQVHYSQAASSRPQVHYSQASKLKTPSALFSSKQA